MINNPYVYKLQYSTGEGEDYMDSVTYNGRYTKEDAKKIADKGTFGCLYRVVLDLKLVEERRINIKDRRQK
jgi:hypothetical protein